MMTTLNATAARPLPQSPRAPQAPAAPAAPGAPAAAAARAQSLGDLIEQQVQQSIEGAQRAAAAADRANQRSVRVENGSDGVKKVITFPDGNGGTSRIEIGQTGVTVNGEQYAGVDFRNAIPNGAVDIVQSVSLALVLCVVGFPLARAFARWLDRRTATPTVSADVSARLAAIENAVESVAVEVERISEGQRFTTKLLNERVAVGVNAAPERAAMSPR